MVLVNTLLYHTGKKMFAIICVSREKDSVNYFSAEWSFALAVSKKQQIRLTVNLLLNQRKSDRIDYFTLI